MEESIYSWVKEVPPIPEKPALHHSKHDPLAKPYRAASTFVGAATKKPFGSIGREVKSTPSTYTKAHERSGPRSGELASSLRECKRSRWHDYKQTVLPSRLLSSRKTNASFTRRLPGPLVDSDEQRRGINGSCNAPRQRAAADVAFTSRARSLIYGAMLPPMPEHARCCVAVISVSLSAAALPAHLDSYSLSREERAEEAGAQVDSDALASTPRCLPSSGQARYNLPSIRCISVCSCCGGSIRRALCSLSLSSIHRRRCDRPALSPSRLLSEKVRARR